MNRSAVEARVYSLQTRAKLSLPAVFFMFVGFTIFLEAKDEIMKFFCSILTAIALVGAVPSGLLAQTLKIGVVNTEIIIKEMPAAKDADAKLNDIGKKYKDTLDQIQQQFTTRYETYEKQKSLMNPEAKAKEEEALAGLRQSFLEYQESKFGVAGEIARMREQFLDPIREQINTAISAVAKDEKLSLVLDKSAGALLYFEEKFDITFRVLDKIKRGG